MLEIKLLICDDHEMYLEGLCLLLKKNSNFSVLNTCQNEQQLKIALAQIQVDILLLDVQLPGTDAEILLQELRTLYPSLKIIYLTLMRGSRFVHRLMKQNIQGYILKSASITELHEAIITVYNGGSFFSNDIDINTDDDYKKLLTIDNNKTETILTAREIEILQYICKEYSNAQIAKQLFLSVGTVDTHRKNIINKLGVTNTVGLVRYAIKHKIIE